MTMAVMSKNKFQFVDGLIATPDKNHSLFSTWQRCNTMVLSWPNRSLSPSIAQSFLWLNKAADVWNDLKDRFSHGDAFRVAKLQERALSISSRFLKGLNDRFANVRSQIMLTEPMPSINKVFFLVIQQERELTGSMESTVCLARTLPKN